MSEISLLNLGGGAAVERFNEELEKVVENILDPNTDAMTKREVIIKVVIKPAKDRSFGAVSVFAASKIAPPVAFDTRAFFGQSEGRYVACEDNPKQVTIDDFLEDKASPKVAQLQTTAKESAQ